MARVVPSQVIALIDQMFSFAATQRDEQSAQVSLGINDSPRLAAIVELADQIPSELLRLDNSRYSELTAALAAIRNALVIWPARGDVFALRNIPGLGNLNPVTLISQTCAGSVPR